jgi:hypothetical protein
LAEQDPVRAQAYYDANKAEVGFAQQPRVEQVLKAEGDNQFAVQFAAQQAGNPLSAQLKAAGEIKDPERRSKALTEVKNNYAMVQQAQIEMEKRVSDQAWQMVGKGQKVPEALLANMDGKERVQLQEHVQARADRLLAGKAVKTDMATYIKVREALMSDDPAVRASVNLLALTEKIAPAQMEQLLDIKSAGSKAGSPKFDSMATDEQRIELGLQAAKIDKKRDPESAGKFIGEVDRRVRALSVSKGGKDVTPDEKQKIIDSVLMDKVFVSEFGRDTQKPLTLLKPEELQNAYVTVNGQDVKLSTIPLTDRQQIMDSLRRRGELATEQAIAEVYLRGRPKTPSAVPAPAPVAPAVPAPAASIYAPTAE